MSNQKFQSAVRAATFAGDDNVRSPGNRGILAVLDVTGVPGVDTVQLVVERKFALSGKYVQVLAAAARAGAGTDVLTVYPGAIAVANVTANDVMSDIYRVRVVHSAATNFTYSVEVIELP
jgi:predicted Zn-dependent protease with MMP-like domain